MPAPLTGPQGIYDDTVDPGGSFFTGITAAPVLSNNHLYVIGYVWGWLSNTVIIPLRVAVFSSPDGVTWTEQDQAHAPIFQDANSRPHDRWPAPVYYPQGGGSKLYVGGVFDASNSILSAYFTMGSGGGGLWSALAGSGLTWTGFTAGPISDGVWQRFQMVTDSTGVCHFMYLDASGNIYLDGSLLASSALGVFPVVLGVTASDQVVAMWTNNTAHQLQTNTGATLPWVSPGNYGTVTPWPAANWLNNAGGWDLVGKYHAATNSLCWCVPFWVSTTQMNPTIVAVSGASITTTTITANSYSMGGSDMTLVVLPGGGVQALWSAGASDYIYTAQAPSPTGPWGAVSHFWDPVANPATPAVYQLLTPWYVRASPINGQIASSLGMFGSTRSPTGTVTETGVSYYWGPVPASASTRSFAPLNSPMHTASSIERTSGTALNRGMLTPEWEAWYTGVDHALDALNSHPAGRILAPIYSPQHTDISREQASGTLLNRGLPTPEWQTWAKGVDIALDALNAHPAARTPAPIYSPMHTGLSVEQMRGTNWNRGLMTPEWVMWSNGVDQALQGLGQ